MYAVVRESTYPPDEHIAQRPEFRQFQERHAAQPGYRGTVVVNVGEGRHYTVTLWETAEAMDAAREALGPVVGALLNPLMTAPPQLLGTGPVVAHDLDRSLGDS